MKNLTTEKSLNFYLDAPLANTDVTISIPALDLSEAKISGDWASHYEFTLSKNIEIQYINHERKETTVLDWKTIKLNAPMLKTTRDETPLTLELIDEHQGLQFSLLYNHDGDIKEVKTELLNGLRNELLA